MQATISTGCKPPPSCSPGAEELPASPPCLLPGRKLVPAELDSQTPQPITSLGYNSTPDSTGQAGGVLVQAGHLHAT